MDLFNDLKKSITSGMSVAAFADKITQTHHRTYITSKLIYYALCHRRTGACTLQQAPHIACPSDLSAKHPSPLPAAAWRQRMISNGLELVSAAEPEPFCSAADFGVHPVTPSYLAVHLCADFRRRRKLLVQRIMMVRGDVLAGDMSFKVISRFTL